jgi:hypothetical protein
MGRRLIFVARRPEMIIQIIYVAKKVNGVDFNLCNFAENGVAIRAAHSEPMQNR